MTGYYGEAPTEIAAFELPQWQEFMHYLYLPVRIPLTDPSVCRVSGRLVDAGGDAPAVFDLPDRLSFLGPAIYTAFNDAREVASHLVSPYVYVTARRGYATPGNPLNRPGFHTDDFGGTDLNYIWTDAYPTRFLLSDEPLTIGDDDAQSMRDMERYAARIGQDGGYYLDGWEQRRDLGLRIEDGPINTLLRLTSHVIHDTPLIPEPGGMRSFFKVSVSTHRYDLVGNSHNHLLDYEWPMYDRQALRNQPGAHQNKDYSGMKP